MKQIAGRAGRYVKDGNVTAFKKRDLIRINQFLENSSQKVERQQRRSKSDLDSSLFDTKIEKACVFPPFNMIESFSDDVLINKGKRLTLVELLEMFAQLAKIGGDYFLKDIKE